MATMRCVLPEICCLRSAHRGRPMVNGLAYDAMHRGAVFQIYVVEADGSGRIKRLTRNVPAKWSPAWSLDGNSIAYAAAVPFNQSTIHLMTADGEYLKQLSVFEDGVESDPDWFDSVGTVGVSSRELRHDLGELKPQHRRADDARARLNLSPICRQGGTHAIHS